MTSYLADIHIHSVASPCGDLDMSPVRIADAAVKAGIQIMALTDHNTTAHCQSMSHIGQTLGLLVIPGAEVTSSEEIHCLCYFPDSDAAERFGKRIEESLPAIANIPEKFGYQVVVNEQEEILRYIEPLLLSASSFSLSRLNELVEELGGVLIPAHVDRPSYSVLSQLGFFPADFHPVAIEVSNPGFASTNPAIPISMPWICSSDAHYLHQIGTKTTRFMMEDLSIPSFFRALRSGQTEFILPNA